ncbi:SMI1/KNR4 family protein [Pedobacter metabolipauper]|uniref:SMI1/KNR4 family protein SUKH-1 n=1 Tax=Pedobacter metabolipauper TaxID=425513 RepID=A0A4R6SXM2_9SPHI|nr:SMI1/KNR4 family protein [Pedobacter metabolipauper]TDQ09452.1 SMI1/KNR4 family protein SUKH-1 [Pedobacter metabolipauper]
MNLTIENIIKIIQADHEKLGIILNSGASVAEIADFEQAMEIKLPKDMRTFYEFTNGFYSDDNIFNIIPLYEMIENGKSDVLPPNDFDFAEYSIYCDMWTISVKDEYTYTIYNTAQTEMTLTDSLSEFLDVFLNEGLIHGIYNWTETIEKRNLANKSPE